MSKVAVLLLLGVILAASAQNSSDAANAIAAALRAKDYGRALQLARAALQKSPHDARFLTLEALAFSGLGESAEALRAYEAALKSAPDYLPALEGAAQIEYNAGSARAGGLLDRILKIQPDNATSHAMMGVLAYKRHDCKAAIEHFRASGNLLSSQPAALEEYGFCLVQAGRANEAISVYQNLVSLAPQDSRAHIHLAAAQLLAGEPQNALATLESILQEADPDAEALDIAANASETLGDTPRAVALLRQAILRKPNDPDLYLDFATLSLDHASFQVGIDMLNAGLRRLPDSAPLYLARGIFYVQTAQYDKGEEDFETAERLDPIQAFSSESESLAQIEEKGAGEALATVRSRLKAHPNDPLLLYLLADALTRNGAQPGSTEFTEALNAAKRSVALKPDLLLAGDLLGNLYLKQGDLSDAIEQCRAVLRADPADQEAIYRLTQALRKSGKTAEIPSLLQRLAQLREEDRKKEAARMRYKLVEPGAPNLP